LELRDLTEIFRESGFKAFRGAIEGGAVVRGLNAGKHDLSRAELDALVDEAVELGAKGLVWAVPKGDSWRSPGVTKFLSETEISGVNEALSAGEGDVLLLVADQPLISAGGLGEVSRRLGRRPGLVE